MEARGSAGGDAEYLDRGPAAYLAEFVGTFALVFFITAAVSLYVTPPSAQDPSPFIDFSVIGLVHVFVLFALIQTLAVASGAHFNPAVTAAMTALRQIKPVDAAIYIVVQLAGAVAAALVTKALLKDEGDGVDYGATLVSESRLQGDIIPGMVAEALGTFFLVWVIVGVAVNPRAAKDWAAFAIGATLGMLVMVIAPLTGAGFNPARSFGPALVSGEFGGTDTFLLVYVLAPVVGAILAAVAYFHLFIAPGKKEPGGFGPVG
jgi:MIP family channel proteins